MKKAYVDIFISSKNNLIVRIKDNQKIFELKKYSYNIDKPFAKENHLFTDESLVKYVKEFIEPYISRFWFISQPLTFYVSIAKFCDKDGLDHILTFAEVLGGNSIELAYLNKSDEIVAERQEIHDNRVASRNCNIGQKKTQFFSRS